MMESFDIDLIKFKNIIRNTKKLRETFKIFFLKYSLFQ